MRSVWLGAALQALTTRSPLALINGVIPADACQVVQGVSYGRGPRQQLDIYIPWRAAGAPVVVFFYGGSWRSGARADYKFVGDALASRGYVTVIADYQLYPQAAYPDFLHDCAQAVAWAAQHCAPYGGDPARLYLVGHSAGAYNAAMLALDRRWLQAHGGSPAMLAGWVGMAGPYDFLPIQTRTVRPVFHYPRTPADSQPVVHAHIGAPPALLMAGSADSMVDPRRNTDGLAQALSAAKADVQSIRYRGLGHEMLVGALARPLRWRAPVLQDLCAFLGKRRGAAIGLAQS
ncbi:alpha/beta hydrolase [Bordetella sp. FB-8]|uniref:alpha/beta hydrolase n=1 Tax=Bordetella sp. FB-8 TaxID=1159870 RepID=UPI00037990CB|nr:alpha/beta hydrolase [Bordetella sp. FB-8]